MTAAESSRSAVRLAAPKPGIVAFAGMTSIGVFLGVSLDGLRSTTYAGYLAALPLSVVTTTLLCLMATARIDAFEDELRVVNILMTWHVPRGSIDTLDTSNGVCLHTAGRVIDSIAWGPSVLQTAVTSRRLRRVQETLRHWVNASSAPGAPVVAAPHRQVRPALLVATVTAALGSVALSVLLWSARTALLPIIDS